MNITRRAALLGATASAVAVTTAAASGLHHAPVVSVDHDAAGLAGLPLAAVHIQRAVTAMGDCHFGKWEVTIRSGEPHQNWGFRQIAPSDPLIAAIDAYRAGCEAFRNTPDNMTAEGEDAAIAATFGPPMEVLAAWDKPALSLAGVAAALRLAADENMGVLGSDISQTMVRAALGYIDPSHRPSARI